MSSESDFLEWVATQQRASEFVRLPAGDDLAVLNWFSGDALLVGIDQVLDGVHFDSTVHSPRSIGRKAMNRNLSDCAAMACLPAAAVASVALPRGVGADYVKELYNGLRETGQRFGCVMVGGDTGSWPGKLALSVTIIGRSDGIAPITRAGARPGDGIYVTGALGGSIFGRHMTFEPRILLARQLAKTGLLTAMIDVSDGLSRDLPRICRRSGVGAIIEADQIPIHPEARQLAVKDGRSPLDHALHDGEDHELLFTASSDPGVGGCVRIGTIVEGSSVRIARDGTIESLQSHAWDHSI